jgi:hypothetical protein
MNFTNGKRHGFRLFKESKVHCQPNTKLLADTGYLGITKLHALSALPKKRSKNHPLTKADKQSNHRVARERVPNEQIIGVFKVVDHSCTP